MFHFSRDCLKFAGNEDDVLTGRKPLTICPGFSCQGGLGKCLPKNKRCDRTVNCLGAEDETDCPIFSTAPSFRGSTSTNNKERWDDLDSDMVAQKTPDYLNKNETKEIENVPDVLVTNATTSKAIAKQTGSKSVHCSLCFFSVKLHCRY